MNEMSELEEIVADIVGKLDNLTVKVNNLNSKIDDLADESKTRKKDVKFLKEEIEEIKKSTHPEEDRTDLTPKQEDIYEDYILSRPEGVGVWDIAEEKDVSYSAGYKILEQLKEKGYIEEVWEKKGNKKKYKPKKKE